MNLSNDLHNYLFKVNITVIIAVIVLFVKFTAPLPKLIDSDADLLEFYC